MHETIPLPELQAAADRVRGSIHRTPLIGSRAISERVGREVLLKCENLQKTGSFKVRGALNRILLMSEEDRQRGVVTVSAGNHAQAVAWAAGRAGVPATVVMPALATRSKVHACEGYGARVVLLGTVFEAFDEALRLAREEHLVFVHPFDDAEIIAGQGTTGLEILEDVPDVTTIVVPLGGGGLISGVALAASGAGHPIRVVGVEPEGAASMVRSLEQGSPVRLDAVETIADGLGSPMAGDRTYAHVRALVDSVVTVTDDEILTAMAFIATRTKLLVEPAGAAGVAALLAERITIAPGGPVVVILSGGNADLNLFANLPEDAPGKHS